MDPDVNVLHAPHPPVVEYTSIGPDVSEPPMSRAIETVWKYEIVPDPLGMAWHTKPFEGAVVYAHHRDATPYPLMSMNPPY
jgi:hypothetical protein